MLFTIMQKKIKYWWININSTELYIKEFKMENKKVEDIAWVKTEDMYYGHAIRSGQVRSVCLPHLGQMLAHYIRSDLARHWSHWH